MPPFFSFLCCIWNRSLIRSTLAPRLLFLVRSFSFQSPHPATSRQVVLVFCGPDFPNFTWLGPTTFEKARILPSHGHCSDEGRHCATESKGIRVRFPCIPLHDRVSSPYPEKKPRSIRLVCARRRADVNKTRDEKARKDHEKNLSGSWEESWENCRKLRKTFS